MSNVLEQMFRWLSKRPDNMVLAMVAGSADFDKVGLFEIVIFLVMI